MAKKTDQIIRQKAPPKKEPLGGGAKFGIFVCIAVAATLAFAAAERLGVTGTHFLFKGETVLREGSRSREQVSPDADRAGKDVRENESSAKKSDARATGKKDDSSSKKTDSPPTKKAADARNKKSSAKKADAPVQPLPLAAFADISRKPHTWPGFIRLTRSRTISMTDPQTGASMGRMEVPSGTVVKVFKVLPTGTLEVFDRTGQKFQVEASGTNFSAAYAAVKNKPKKKANPKKVVARNTEKTEPKNAPAIAVPPVSDKKKSGATPVMSAFGVASEDDEWEDDADYE